MHSSSSRLLPKSAVFNMRLPILVGTPRSYRNYHDHTAQLQSAGHDSTHPIVIDDSDNNNEGDIGSSVPTVRHNSQARKRTSSSRRGQINITIQKNRCRNQESSSFSHSQSESSPDVFYPDLSTKLPRVRNDINAVTVAQEVVSVATRQCPVCGDDSPIAELPSLAGCEHKPQTCSTCNAGWITAQLQESSWTEARCPESTCHVKMTYDEIQQYAPVNIFQQYDTFLTRALLNADCRFRHPALWTR
jgi:hypothetical protein